MEQSIFNMDMRLMSPFVNASAGQYELVTENINNTDAGDDGNLVPADPNTGRRFDVLFDTVLPAGDYTVAITQFSNFANGPNLSDGFVHDGAGNFTGPACGVIGGSFLDTGSFHHTDRNIRSSIIGVEGIKT